MYYVYLIKSLKHHHWYIGFTENPSQRLQAHNEGRNVSTYSGRPWDLLYFEAYRYKLDALGRERFLKSGSGHRFLKKQLRYELVGQ
jgi:putative endonuclease